MSSFEIQKASANLSSLVVDNVNVGSNLVSPPTSNTQWPWENVQTQYVEGVLNNTVADIPASSSATSQLFLTATSTDDSNMVRLPAGARVLTVSIFGVNTGVKKVKVNNESGLLYSIDDLTAVRHLSVGRDLNVSSSASAEKVLVELSSDAATITNAQLQTLRVRVEYILV